MAADSVDEVIDAKWIAESVTDFLVGRSEVSVAELSRIVEEQLCLINARVGRAYIEHRASRDLIRAYRGRPENRWLGDFIDRTKYCRALEDGQRETWYEAVERDAQMHRDYYTEWISDGAWAEGPWGLKPKGSVSEVLDLIDWSFDFVKKKWALPSMRSLQFGGEAILLNHNRMYNCRALTMSRIGAWADCFYLLLCGCGVGYSVQWEHVNCLPSVGKVGRTVWHYTVEDTIEGWANALACLVNSYMDRGFAGYGCYVEYDYSRVRAEGSRLRVSGGLAPGHLGLKAGLERVRDLLDRASGRNLRPIEVSDINCLMAYWAVLSGGVRRASLIALFSASDGEMMYSKYPGNYEPGGHRDMANISCVLDPRDSGQFGVFVKCLELAESGYGEPGYYFTDNIDKICNPCGEIRMDCSDGEIGECNLSTINAAYWGEDVVRAATVIGMLQSGYKNYKYIGKQTNSVRDNLIGVGITGLCDRPDIGRSEYKSGAQLVLRESERLADVLGVGVPVRCTDIAPNGTGSLSLGCVGAGVHSQPARRYLRRVTCNDREPVFRLFKEYNSHMCIEKPNGDWVIEFPVEADSRAKVGVKGQAQLDLVRRIYESWVLSGDREGSRFGHNVSCSIMCDDRVSLAKQVWDSRCPAAGTFVPEDLWKRFPYCPQEPIWSKALEARWNEIIDGYREVDWSRLGGDVVDFGAACSGGSCGT